MNAFGIFAALTLAWVSNERAGTVTVIDTATDKVVTVPVGARPRGIHVSADGKRFTSTVESFIRRTAFRTTSP